MSQPVSSFLSQGLKVCLPSVPFHCRDVIVSLEGCQEAIPVSLLETSPYSDGEKMWAQRPSVGHGSPGGNSCICKEGIKAQRTNHTASLHCQLCPVPWVTGETSNTDRVSGCVDWRKQSTDFHQRLVIPLQ